MCCICCHKSKKLTKSIAAIWFGTNDSSRRRNVLDFKNDLKSLTTSFFETRPASNNTYHPPSLLLMSLPPCAYNPLSLTREFARVTKEVAEELALRSQYPVVYVDIHESMEIEAWRRGDGDFEKGIMELTHEGVHPNAEGYGVSACFHESPRLFADDLVVHHTSDTSDNTIETWLSISTRDALVIPSVRDILAVQRTALTMTWFQPTKCGGSSSTLSCSS